MKKYLKRKMADMINKPDHYEHYSFEPRDVIDEITSEYSGDLAWNVGNTLKYIARAPFKGKMLEDLRKAANYLAHAIELMEVRTNDI